MYDIEFKGETCEVHGTYIRQRPNITVPVEEVELYRVAGRDGVLTGRVFGPIVLTGYVPDLLKSVSIMGNRVYLSGSGYCGKGYKEWVKVSDGGPCMKARIRLG